MNSIVVPAAGWNGNGRGYCRMAFTGWESEQINLNLQCATVGTTCCLRTCFKCSLSYGSCLFFTKSHGVELATNRGVLDFWTPKNVETTLKLLLHPIPGKARLPVADVIRILEDSQRRGSPPGFLGLGCVENLVKL